MKTGDTYRICFVMTEKELRYLIKALEKAGGSIGLDLISIIELQKEQKEQKDNIRKEEEK